MDFELSEVDRDLVERLLLEDIDGEERDALRFLQSMFYLLDEDLIRGELGLDGKTRYYPT